MTGLSTYVLLRLVTATIWSAFYHIFEDGENESHTIGSSGHDRLPYPQLPLIITPKYESPTAPPLLCVASVRPCWPEAATLAPTSARPPRLNGTAMHAELLDPANPRERSGSSFGHRIAGFHALSILVLDSFSLHWHRMLVLPHYPCQPSHVPTTHPLRQLNNIPTRLTPSRVCQPVAPLDSLLADQPFLAGGPPNGTEVLR